MINCPDENRDRPKPESRRRHCFGILFYDKSIIRRNLILCFNVNNHPNSPTHSQNLSRQNRSSPENQSWPERSSETHSLFTFGSDYRTESFFLSLLVHYFKGISIRNQC
ncbi:hypothetical protein HanXRQr2_Chr07g0305411 [Helianthus annuus]|uniref:Uncharacterized protein n=1 Tax=Helianthus annuus TaxID=4232 RepID=A0A251V3B9_HELAN|nr:hypothetical protein HanXRQr2_Chr07g0305401 [Helianthus annuus]KAF5799516.1 hypothetical protein HanXRQr2_Chr07g0305411 [Helianthus annuus]KAJ0905593.1 hypothetical protein HanPSC8_Chr07g0295721 [Helianthus annuus]KAJ0905594.1 hypothetical protein HanPSC8_Chr07g0295731 [Helianthus annuus]